MEKKVIQNMKWLLPVLALVVIFESVILVGKLNKKTQQSDSGVEDITRSPEETFSEAPSSDVEGYLSLKLEGESSASATRVAKVVFEPTTELSLDGMELMVSYDPQKVEIVDAVSSESGTQVLPLLDVSTIAANKVNRQNGTIVLSMLEVERDKKIELLAGTEIELFSFEYKVTGGEVPVFEIVMPNDDGVGTLMAKSGRNGQTVNIQIKN